MPDSKIVVRFSNAVMRSSARSNSFNEESWRATQYITPTITKVVHKTNITGRILSKYGDVLVPGTTTADAMGIAIARALDEDGVILGGDINIIRTNNSYLLAKFLAYVLSYTVKSELASHAKGTNILHLYNKDIKKIRVPVPAIEKQKEF